MACTRFSPDGVSRYSVIFWPPKLIDWIPDTERHGRTWQQAMLWFLGNFQYFTIPIGFVGPALGLSLGWSILAGALGIGFGTLFMAFHATQGPVFGLPQMIQTRAQLG
jgi:purine-cytosine permease-like protein